jgi:hypothetical protein
VVRRVDFLEGISMMYVMIEDDVDFVDQSCELSLSLNSDHGI